MEDGTGESSSSSSSSSKFTVWNCLAQRGAGSADVSLRVRKARTRTEDDYPSSPQQPFSWAKPGAYVMSIFRNLSSPAFAVPTIFALAALPNWRFSR